MSHMLDKRGFHIVTGSNDPIDACAQFKYNDYLVSMSSLGRSQGACMTAVAVFASPDYVDPVGGNFHTVQDAIDWINQQENS